MKTISFACAVLSIAFLILSCSAILNTDKYKFKTEESIGSPPKGIDASPEVGSGGSSGDGGAGGATGEGVGGAITDGPGASGAGAGGTDTEVTGDGGAGGATGEGVGGAIADGPGASGAGAGGAGARATGDGDGAGGMDKAGGSSGAGTGGAGAKAIGDGGDIDAALIPGCEPIPADVKTGIFVSPAGSAAVNCGSAASPCSTVALGIERAISTSRAYVYLDTGKYTESVTLKPGVTLLGGWDNISGEWTRQCKDNRAQSVLIASPSAIAVSAEYEGEATLDTLSIHTKPTVSDGESLYGIFARGAKTVLNINDVLVSAFKGGDGAKGNPGVTPPAPTGTCSSADDNAAGSPDGTIGDGAPAGQFTSDGYKPADGQQGHAGVVGHNGTVGSNGCIDCTDGTSCTEEPCNTTLCDRFIRGCVGAVVTDSESCGKGGAPGCGGLPSSGSGGGHGGGSSIALFVWDAIVIVKSGTLTAAEGGKGATGGDTTPGGPGSSGGWGSVATTSCAHACYRDFSSGTGEKIVIGRCTDHTNALGSGTQGATGGAGSAGGPGGGGAGGFSYAVYRGGNAKVTLSPETRLAHGNAGTSASNGAGGLAADVGP